MKRISKGLSALCAAALVLSALAATASAKHVDSYSAELYLSLSHKRTGYDGTIANVVWNRDTQMRAQVKTLAGGIEFEDEKMPGPRPLNPKMVVGTGVEDLITVTVDGGLMITTCVNDGQGYASPGQISWRKAKVDGKAGMEVIVRPFNTFQVNAVCSGFSSATGIFDFSADTPVAKAKLPLMAIGMKTIKTSLSGTAPCPVTAQTEATTSCESKWFGELTLKLEDSYDVGRNGTKTRSDTEPFTGGGPTGNPLVDNAIAQIDRVLGKGTVKVPCPRACTGRVSAYAVARQKRLGSSAQKPRLLGRATLSSPRRGGIGKAVVGFDAADRERLRERGAVEFRVLAKRSDGGKPVRGKVTVALPGS